VWSTVFGFIGAERTSNIWPSIVGAIGQVKSTYDCSCRVGFGCIAWAFVFDLETGMSTATLPGSRNGALIVACSPQKTGRSNPSRLVTVLSTHTMFSPSTM
jgi:hypothetical protein